MDVLESCELLPSFLLLSLKALLLYILSPQYPQTHYHASTEQRLMCLQLTLSFFTFSFNLPYCIHNICSSAFEQRSLSAFHNLQMDFSNRSLGKYCMILHTILKLKLTTWQSMRLTFHKQAELEAKTLQSAFFCVQRVLAMLFQTKLSSIFLYGSWLEWERNATLKDESSSRTVATEFTADLDKRGTLCLVGILCLTDRYSFSSFKNTNSCCTVEQPHDPPKHYSTGRGHHEVEEIMLFCTSAAHSGREEECPSHYLLFLGVTSAGGFSKATSPQLLKENPQRMAAGGGRFWILQCSNKPSQHSISGNSE